MAAGELRRRLLDYMSDRSGGTELKKVLRNNSADIRYDLLMSVRGDNAWTGVFKAAREGDVEMVRCMLAEFTPEQGYSVLELQTGGNTPLHTAACWGHVEMVKYLLSCVNQQQRFNLLMMKECIGRTVLHAALANNKRDTAELILSTLSLQQQLQLINFKNIFSMSVADLYPDFIPEESVAKGLPAVIDELRQGQAELKSTVDGQAAVIAEQKMEIAGQKEQIVKQKEKITNQKQEAAQLKQEIQRGKDKQTELEKKLSALEEKFDIFIRTPIVLGGEDDHEHVS